MNGELWGIGRFWLTAWLVIVCATVAFIMGKLPATEWTVLVTTALGGGAVKSAVGATRKPK